MSAIAATNHKAYRDYQVLEAIEAGIELKGSEVKSIRAGKINLDDSFARLEKGQIILYNTHITPYAEASYLNVEPTRPRRLLLHKKQITKLTTQLTQRGLTLVPLKVYFNAKGFAKIELAICKGKKLYDKREDIKRKELDRGMRRLMKRRDR
ncbi:MAG: SsrA-binding protein SmpB [Candidatus Omnitrophica bacterium]|nr:SsrA-binding protein SmpB [Candidatus Omnitrophota bacterium]